MPFVDETPRSLLDVVSTISRAVGYSSGVSDAAGSTDPAVVQMVDKVNEALEELATEPWQELIKVESLTVLADFPGQQVKGYPLPDDFYAFVLQTQNDRTVRRPAFGPLAPQIWESIRNINPYVSFNLMFRVFQNQIQFLNPPSTGGREFTYEYLSQGLVRDADDASLLKNRCEKNGDLILIDPVIVRQLARCKWLESRGFESASARNDFNHAFSQRFNRQVAAPVLSMAGRAANQYPPFVPISIGNAPNTGYGSG